MSVVVEETRSCVTTHCESVPKDLIQCCSNKHFICYKCMTQVLKCPMCRERTIFYKSVELMKSKYDTLKESYKDLHKLYKAEKEYRSSLATYINDPTIQTKLDQIELFTVQTFSDSEDE